MPTKKVHDIEFLKRCLLENKSNKEIAILFGVSEHTITNLIYEHRLSGLRQKKRWSPGDESETGFNADRHLCVDCRYRYKEGFGCNYYCITGKLRGCDACVCDKYEKEHIRIQKRCDMTTIELKNGYYIEVDALNYTLKQRYKGKTQDGKEKDASRIHGYFGKISQAIERYLFLAQLDVMDAESVSLKEYAEIVDKSNKIAVQGLESVLSGFPIK